mgnify:CR=1 FL=1
MPDTQPLWIWEDALKRYRHTDTGRFIGAAEMMDLRDEFMARQKLIMSEAVDKYRAGSLSLTELRDRMKYIVKQTTIDMYAMGAGGRNNLSQRDWGRIGAMVKDQYNFLRGFVNQIAEGRLSQKQIESRMAMYINSANEALWKALTRDYGFSLPAYPGDGSTSCLTNCRCTWNITKVPDGYDCYWILGDAEHCDECRERAVTWSPWKYPESRNERNLL